MYTEGDVAAYFKFMSWRSSVETEENNGDLTHDTNKLGKEIFWVITTPSTKLKQTINVSLDIVTI
jgi:hypothetical protein